jgi:hypothetical protein
MGKQWMDKVSKESQLLQFRIALLGPGGKEKGILYLLIFNVKTSGNWRMCHVVVDNLAELHDHVGEADVEMVLAGLLRVHNVRHFPGRRQRPAIATFDPRRVEP